MIANISRGSRKERDKRAKRRADGAITHLQGLGARSSFQNS